jgi:glutamate-1-semialdehyde 2,1-aminomutase
MSVELVSEKQRAMYTEARRYLVGGGSAGGRYNATYEQPLYLCRCDGSKLCDIDGKTYIDYHTSAGPVLFGYNNPRLKKAAERALEK